MADLLNRANVVTAVAVVLIVAVTLPSWVGFLAVLTGQMNPDLLREGRGLGVEFYVMLFEPASHWEVARGALALVVAAAAAADLATGRIGLRGGVVMAALAIAFIPLLVLLFYLGNPDRVANIWNVISQDNMVSEVRDNATFNRGWNSYLIGQMQLLGSQLALFLGLKGKSQ